MNIVQEDSLTGECRCCLAIGKHRDIMKEYYFNGVREVYYDIFGHCFNLFLSKNPKLTTLICDNCIMRLRDAYSFRMMVVSTETTLLNLSDRYSTIFVNVTDTNNSLDIKREEIIIKVENDEEMNCDVTSDYDNLDQKPCSSQYLVEGEAELLSKYNFVKPLPRRADLYKICPTYVKQLDKLKNVNVTSKMISNMISVEHTLTESVTDKRALISNIATMIFNSNMTPFRSKSRFGYPCFNCRVVYEDFDKLRKHYHEHTRNEIIQIMNQYRIESFIVYVDVTDLKCILCDSNMTIQELKTHLTEQHKKKFYNNVSDRVVPFKINKSFECQKCSAKFETFGAIERHMNGHYRNYVCKICGTGFVTRCRLKVHVKSMHVNGSHPCNSCTKKFPTHQKLRNHINTVHRMLKRFKCTKCTERFTEYFTRQKHMVDVHGVPPLKYNCNVCDRVFDRRYTLSRHMKRDHLEERDFECELCGYKCFTGNEFKVHMIKHNGERIFECNVCKKSYARKKTLKEHMRIHANDRRFVCMVCGQAFVQKCSLKGHIKTHHIDYNFSNEEINV